MVLTFGLRLPRSWQILNLVEACLVRYLPLSGRGYGEMGRRRGTRIASSGKCFVAERRALPITLKWQHDVGSTGRKFGLRVRDRGLIGDNQNSCRVLPQFRHETEK